MKLHGIRWRFLCDLGDAAGRCAELRPEAGLGAVGGEGPALVQGPIQVNALKRRPLLEDRAKLILVTGRR